MPADDSSLTDGERQSLEKSLHDLVAKADREDVVANGRGPMRRLNREEYEQNLRDVLQLPQLDIRDMLPEDREGHRFNKTRRNARHVARAADGLSRCRRGRVATGDGQRTEAAAGDKVSRRGDELVPGRSAPSANARRCSSRRTTRPSMPSSSTTLQGRSGAGTGAVSLGPLALLRISAGLHRQAAGRVPGALLGPGRVADRRAMSSSPPRSPCR